MDKYSLSRKLEYFKSCSTSQVATGVVSKNTVDATIELAYQYGIPFALLASRRQIEAEQDRKGRSYTILTGPSGLSGDSLAPSPTLLGN